MPDLIEQLQHALSDRYKIERELGQGGMATVYLAHDLKHDRKVAIKVLKLELAAVLGGERFLAEIKTTANLQHPHILPLHDSGEVDGTVFYVMPFIDGETVRTRLEHEKQLAVPEAVRLATEVAAALDYAHRHGVIHRDIKPENILLQDGSALVADFGIALAASRVGGTRMTETGISLGTPHYMSPEQALGEREITARSDIYALGAVLYEMLSGEPPFTGPTVQAVIAKVVTDEPRPPRQLRKTIPGNVEAAVLTALAKLPADRFASAAAFAEALANPAFAGTATTGTARPARSLARRVVGAASWLVVGALGAMLALRIWAPRAQGGSASHVQITYAGRAFSPAISPDGRFVAFKEVRCPEPPTTGGCANLEVTEVGASNSVEILSGADHLDTPRWTRDGLSLVVGGGLGGGRTGLFVIPRLGGTPRRIADDPNTYAIDPTSDSVIVVVPRGDSSTLRVIPLAGEPAGSRSVTIPDRLMQLAWSPDGRLLAASLLDYRHFLIMDRKGSVLSQPDLINPRGPLRWSADGHFVLTFAWGAGEEDDLMALPVSRDGKAGTAVRLASRVTTLLEGKFDVARTTGRLVVGSGLVTTDLWSFDFQRPIVRARRLTQGSNWYGPPVLSADGHTIYYLRADGLGDNLYTISGGREHALTAERHIVNNAGRFSLDGTVFAFETFSAAVPLLTIYDVADGTTRVLPRGTSQMIAWVTRRGGDIVWLDQGSGAAWITDSAGGSRRDLSTSVGGLEFTIGRGGFMLAPDGASLALLADSRDGLRLERVPLDGGPPTMLATFPNGASDLAADLPLDYVPIGVGLAGWSREGIWIAEGGGTTGETRLSLLDPRTRALRPAAVLPAACSPRAVSVARDARIAACLVPDTRADVIVIDGLTP